MDHSGFLVSAKLHLFLLHTVLGSLSHFSSSCGIWAAVIPTRQLQMNEMTIFHVTQRDSKNPSADALARFQESITKLHRLLLEQAASGETENRLL